MDLLDCKIAPWSILYYVVNVSSTILLVSNSCTYFHDLVEGLKTQSKCSVDSTRTNKRFAFQAAPLISMLTEEKNSGIQQTHRPRQELGLTRGSLIALSCTTLPPDIKSDVNAFF
ncbi:uncharacterized protein [Miscanthus floridulus]|uniref:uncharacterized protein isoform X3 n=1 Tax=Miscanthus floridulus TaxID=154761 RepID=UPI00345AD496